MILQQNALSCQKNAILFKKKTFLQKRAVFGGAQGSKLQEIAGGVSGLKNQERYPTFTRPPGCLRWGAKIIFRCYGP